MTFEIDFIQRAETPQSDKLDNNVKANYVPPRNIKIFDFLFFSGLRHYKEHSQRLLLHFPILTFPQTILQ